MRFQWTWMGFYGLLMDLYHGILMGFQWISVDVNQGLVNVPIKHHSTIGKVISRYFFRWGSKSQGTFANLYINLTLLAGKHRTGKLAKIPKMSMISPCHGLFAGKGQTSSPRVESFSLPTVDHGLRWAKHQASGGVGPLPTWTGCGDSCAARLCGRRGHGAGLGPWRMEQVTFTRLYYNLTIGFSGISSVI